MRSRLALLVLGVLAALTVPAQTANPPTVKGIVLHKEKYLAQIDIPPPVVPPVAPPVEQPPTSTTATTVTSTTVDVPTSTSTSVQPPAATSTSTAPNPGRPKPTATSSTLTRTTTSTSASTPTSTPNTNKNDGDDNQGLIVAGSAVGGLVFAIGLAIVTFKIIVARKERQRRQKEFAAALSDSYYPGGAANALTGGGVGGGGYRELHDDTTALRDGGANISRHESNSDGHGGQPYYYKESGHSQPYVQERYGGNNGTYGMYEETEMSVIGGPAGGSHGPAYPPASMRHREDYDYGYGQQQPPSYGGNYGGGGGYDNYSYGKGGSGY